jgi:hypothetical protein
MLRTYPFVRIWHAGCSTGEEVYSMAILLQEEGLYDRCRIYATDMNEPVLDKARKGIIPLASMKENTANYLAGGGAASFSDYYTANYDSAIFHPSLTRERRLRAAQSGNRRLLQSLQCDFLPERLDLLQSAIAGAGPRTVSREPRDVRNSRSGQEGIAQVHLVRELVRGAE